MKMSFEVGYYFMIGIRKKFPTTVAVTSLAIAIPLYSWIMYATGSSLPTIVFMVGTTSLGMILIFLACAIIIRRNARRADGPRRKPDDRQAQHATGQRNHPEPTDRSTMSYSIPPKEVQQSSLLVAFKNWLHEGEDDCIRVYRRPYVGRLLWVVLSCALLCLTMPERARPVLLAVTAALIARFLFEGRRAIIFTEDSLIYRPPFGRARRILTRNIVSVTPATAVVSIYLTPEFVRGIKLETTSGEPYLMPMDFPNHAEISQRLTASSGGGLGEKASGDHKLSKLENLRNQL
jgi:hypothetical protein